MNRRTSKLVIIGAAALLVVAILFAIAGRAMAAAPARCSDTRGSLLALHVRTVCKQTEREAKRVSPRRYHVYVNCATTNRRVVSSCAWEVRRYGKRLCSGNVHAVGRAHVKVKPAIRC